MSTIDFQFIQIAYLIGRSSANDWQAFTKWLFEWKHDHKPNFVKISQKFLVAMDFFHGSVTLEETQIFFLHLKNKNIIHASFLFFSQQRLLPKLSFTRHYQQTLKVRVESTLTTAQLESHQKLHTAKRSKICCGGGPSHSLQGIPRHLKEISPKKINFKCLLNHWKI